MPSTDQPTTDATTDHVTASSASPKRWLWRLCKWALAAAVLFAVGRAFARDLSELSETSFVLRPGWLLLSVVLYLGGLAFSGTFWFILLRRFGQQPEILATFRAYYVGHLGKYIPGKAVALFLRGSMLAGPNVRLSVALLSAVYEVLTTMAAGALLAAVIFAFQPPIDDLPWNPVLTGLLLAGLAGVPLMPAIFNRVVARVSSRIQGDEPPPRLPTVALGEGIALTSCGWVLLGLSVWAILNCVLNEPLALDATLLLGLAASLALAYVAGFLAVFVPGGLGVREGILLALLVPLAPSSEALVALAVLLLRVVWTASEVVAAAAMYVIRPRLTAPTDPTAGSE